MNKMKLDFDKPLVPNFIRMKGLKETIPIEQLSQEDIDEYATLWLNTLKENWERRKEDKECEEK